MPYKNLEAQRANRSEWKKENPEKVAESAKKCHAKYREKHNKYQKEWRHKKKEEILDFLGGKCSSPDCKWVNDDGSYGCND